FDNSLLPWSLDSALFALGFYALGNIFSDQIKKLIVKIKSSQLKLPICIAAIILCLAAGIPLALLNGKVSLGSKILGNGFLFYLTGIIGTVFILSLSIIFEKSKLLKYCGKVSFYIMAIHYLIRMILSKTYVILGIEAYNSTVLKECIIPIILITILSILSALVYDKTVKFISLTPVNRKTNKKTSPKR
ncbi:MAG: hypothetical protein IJ261_02960, partial [Clostridia bacterium]|nr:hypothetical protein [Clostridia bacterium]